MGYRITMMVSLLLLSFCVWWSGIVGIFLSPYKPFETRWAAYVYDEQERIQTQGYWLTEIVDKHYRFNSLLWIPNSDNTGGFLEVSFNKRKAVWWDILSLIDTPQR